MFLIYIQGSSSLSAFIQSWDISKIQYCLFKMNPHLALWLLLVLLCGREKWAGGGWIKGWDLGKSLARGCFMPLDKSAIPLCPCLDTFGDVSIRMFLHIWMFLSMMLSIHCLEGRCLDVQWTHSLHGILLYLETVLFTKLGGRIVPNMDHFSVLSSLLTVTELC